MSATESWSHHEAIVNGIRLHWVEQGSGPLVVLLHGFPEFWYSWRHQIPALARRFRVIAPDMRGYNLSEKPPAGYDTDTLADDVLGLIREAGEEHAAVVGHDWGGGVAWAFALRHPAATRRLAILNAPHPLRFLRELRRPRQLLRSSYMLLFQLPWLPELLLGANRCWAIGRMLRAAAANDTAFDAEDIERYRDAMSRPGALRAALTYYRRLPGQARRLGRLPNEGVVQAPTLVIWGQHDRALGVDLARGLEPWVPDLTVHVLDCGHWSQQERPEEVNRLLLDFLSASD